MARPKARSTKQKVSPNAEEELKRRKIFIEPIAFETLINLPPPNGKQKMFCIYHCELGQAKPKEAYLKAYPNCTPAAASACASELLKKPNIIAYIQQLERYFLLQVEVNATRFRAEISTIAFSNILHYFSFDEETRQFSVKPPTEWLNPEAVSELTTKTYKGETTISIKLHNKMPALEMCAKMLGEISDLNTALASLRRYGYEIEQHTDGLLCRDNYNSGKTSISEALEKIEEYGFKVETVTDGYFLRSEDNAAGKIAKR